VIRKGDRVIKVPEPVANLVVEEVPLEEEATVPPTQHLIVPKEKQQSQQQEEQLQQKRTPAEIKKWQREQEAARKAFMKVNKISRASLMTVANMRNWLEAGDTYAKIAREQLGCKEEEVSKFAKEHGLSKKQRV
jgi:hypothetical protein